MALSNINPTETAVWEKLNQHYTQIKNVSMQEMFANDTSRAEKFHIQWNDFLIDYSKNRISAETMQLLQQLAEEVKLKEAISSYFEGDKINRTENRSVLHTALRSTKNVAVFEDGKNVIPEVFEVKKNIKKFTDEIISATKKVLLENHLQMW